MKHPLRIVIVAAAGRGARCSRSPPAAAWRSRTRSRSSRSDRDRHAAGADRRHQLLRHAEPGRRADRRRPDQQEGRRPRSAAEDHQRGHEVRPRPHRGGRELAARQGRARDDPDPRLRLRRAVRAGREREEDPGDLRGGRLPLRSAGNRQVPVQPVPVRQRGRDRGDLGVEQGLAQPVRPRRPEHQLLEDLHGELQVLVGQAGARSPARTRS